MCVHVPTTECLLNEIKKNPRQVKNNQGINNVWLRIVHTMRLLIIQQTNWHTSPLVFLNAKLLCRRAASFHFFMAYELKEFMIEKYLSRFESVGCKSPMMNHNGWCLFKNKCAVQSIPTAGIWEAFVMNLWWTVGWQIEKHEYCKHLQRFTYKLTHLICSLKANRFKWLPLAECRNVFGMQEWFCILVKRCMCILV